MDKPSPYSQSLRVRDVLQSAKFKKYKGASSNQDVEGTDHLKTDNLNACESVGGSIHGETKPEVDEKREESSSKSSNGHRQHVEIEQNHKIRPKKECKESSEKKKGEKEIRTTRNTEATSSPNISSTIPAHGPANLQKQKFMNTVRKRSVNHLVAVEDDVTISSRSSGRSNHQQQRQKAMVSNPRMLEQKKEPKVVQPKGQNFESSFNLKKALQSNKNISTSTIERILAIESECRKELMNQNPTLFKREYSNYPLRSEVIFDNPVHSDFNVMDYNNPGENNIVSNHVEVSPRDKAKEIIARRNISKYPEAFRKLVLAPSPQRAPVPVPNPLPVPVMKHGVRLQGPNIQTQSLRSFPTQVNNIPYKYQVRNLANSRLLRNAQSERGMNYASAERLRYHTNPPPILEPKTPISPLYRSQNAVGMKSNLLVKNRQSPRTVVHNRGVEYEKSSPRESTPGRVMNFSDIMSKMDRAYMSLSRPFVPAQQHAAVRKPTLTSTRKNNYAVTRRYQSPVSSHPRSSISSTSSRSSSVSSRSSSTFGSTSYSESHEVSDDSFVSSQS